MTQDILVVEDSATFRAFLVKQLQRANYNVVAVATYAEASLLLEQRSDFFCAVLDYCLPDATNGEVIDLALQCKQRVIVLTASFHPQNREYFITQGVLDYLTKDNNNAVSDLLVLIERLAKNRHHHALIVDDSQMVRNHLSELLNHQYIKVTAVENGQLALDELQTSADISFIVTDHAMPVMDGVEMIREIRKTSDRNSLPILGLSGSEDKMMTAKFLKAGANDFLYKPFNQEELYCRVHSLLSIKEANDELYRLANQDELTGLWNRRYFFSYATAIEDLSQANLAIIDIDDFKLINDNYGHEAGDFVIKTVARVLSLHFPNAIVSRFGGEEFSILYVGEPEHFFATLDKMRHRIAEMFIPYETHQLNITISLGATSAPSSIDNALRIADKYLYTSKAAGKNQLIVDGD